MPLESALAHIPPSILSHFSPPPVHGPNELWPAAYSCAHSCVSLGGKPRQLMADLRKITNFHHMQLPSCNVSREKWFSSSIGGYQRFDKGRCPYAQAPGILFCVMTRNQSTWWSKGLKLCRPARWVPSWFCHGWIFPMFMRKRDWVYY